jgi:ankyrin repeat protein
MEYTLLLLSRPPGHSVLPSHPIVLRPQEGSTPLHYACKRGQLEVVHRLMATGAVGAIDKVQPPARVLATWKQNPCLPDNLGCASRGR